MRWLAATVLVWLATVAGAETIKVSSGEHADFSRLVLAVPTDSAWRLGRTEGGYELDLGQADTRFDLSTVFDLIPRDRLAGIFADPVTGNLRLTVRCACHAIPFSLDARTLVIDLRDGPPPDSSSFEISLDGEAVTPLQGRGTARPRPRQAPAIAEFAWLRIPDLRLLPTPAIPPVLPEPQQVALRETLVEQLAEGAARGVVDLALPSAPGPVTGSLPLPDGSPLRVGSTPGLQVGPMTREPVTLQADGAACIDDDRLNIAAWGATADVPGQLGRARAALVGEFDVPRDDAVADQVRLYLFLGFGAETLALLSAMPQPDDDAPIWRVMAALIDGSPDAGTAFDGMARCDGAAALWALLAAPVDDTTVPDIAAVQRTFSALPSHLRTLIGPQIVDRLLARGQRNAAQGITDAMGRGAVIADPVTLLAEADLDMMDGAPHEALAKADSARAAGGISAPAAMIAQVRAQIAAGDEIDPSVAEALDAFRAEYQGQDIAPDLAEAHQLALIGSGQFGAALSDAAADVPIAFWAVIATRGSDDDILQFAFVAPAEVGEAISSPVATQIGNRLLTLGFPDAAAAWVALGVPAPDVVAEGHQGADGDAAARALRWEQNWAEVAAADNGPWQELAVQLSGPPPTAQPPLAHATELVEASEATRGLIDALMQATAPSGG
jgi:hypothetical protein